MSTFNLDPPSTPAAQKQFQIMVECASAFQRCRFIIHPPFWRIGDAMPYFLYAENGELRPISRRQSEALRKSHSDFCVTIMPTGEWEIKYDP